MIACPALVLTNSAALLFRVWSFKAAQAVQLDQTLRAFAALLPSREEEDWRAYLGAIGIFNSAQLMLWDHLQHDLPQDYPSSSIFDARQQQHKWQEVVETAQIFSPSAADGSSTTTAMTPFLLHAMHLMAEGLQRRVTQLLEETEGCKRRLRVLREIIMS
ncbi:hypothetical protein VTN96DRAFT_5807 [Rasamsonia emersonii]